MTVFRLDLNNILYVWQMFMFTLLLPYTADISPNCQTQVQNFNRVWCLTIIAHNCAYIGLNKAQSVISDIVTMDTI